MLHAEDTTLARAVAIKMMQPAFAAHAGAKERFLREARSLAAVESEYIVPIYHVGETLDGTPYLVMPLLAGETLDARLGRGTLSEAELVAIVRHAAEGLNAAHAKGMIHRDIKPSNLWLEADAEVRFRRARLLDFGLARPTQSETEMTATGQLLGTPAYMSPEQANGDPLAPATDLFSLGATLYRSASGRRPFGGDTPMKIVKSLALDTPAPVRRLAPALSEPVARLNDDQLHKDPTRRPTAPEVVNRLDAPTEGVITKAKWRWPSIRFTCSVAVTFCVLLTVIPGIVIIVRDKDGKEVGRVTVPDGGSVFKKDGIGPEQQMMPPPTATAPPSPKPGEPLSKKALVVIQTKDGQQTLTPAEFETRTGWKNDPSKVGLPK